MHFPLYSQCYEFNNFIKYWSLNFTCSDNGKIFIVHSNIFSWLFSSDCNFIIIGECECEVCIMAATGNARTMLLKFSSCSKRDLKYVIQSDQYICLYKPHGGEINSHHQIYYKILILCLFSNLQYKFYQ